VKGQKAHQTNRGFEIPSEVIRVVEPDMSNITKPVKEKLKGWRGEDIACCIQSCELARVTKPKK